MVRLTTNVVLSGVLCVWSVSAFAQASAEVATTRATSNHASSSPIYDLAGEANASDTFFERFRPTQLSVEVGAFVGLAWLPADHNLQDLDLTFGRGQQSLATGGEFGLRLAVFPNPYLGVEAEGGGILTHTQDSDHAAQIWFLRGHAILQVPAWRIVPFILAGGGVLALRSSDDALGNDADPVFHIGLGAKFAITRLATLRLDVRDSFFQRNKLLADTEAGDIVHNIELLAGFSLTFGRTPWAPAPRDSDGDDVLDREDHCPREAGPAPTGCPLPPPPPDTDGDGLSDVTDPCPTEAEDGNAPDPHDGCPNKDLDGDNVLLPADLCPEIVGVEPDGCPPPDTDGDGLVDPSDRCPNEPETRNNFEDGDGCPDELPQEVLKFTGVIKGILFDTGEATIRASSFPLLNDAVEVLQRYVDLRIRVSGHTDSKGNRDRNVKLSQARAEAVREYLESHGVAASRVTTRGVGPDEPVADNKTESGRAQNRRIEFELLPQ